MLELNLDAHLNIDYVYITINAIKIFSIFPFQWLPFLKVFGNSDTGYCWMYLGSSWWHPSSIAYYCWMLHEAWLFSSNGPIHQAVHWECTMAYWSHYGWYPWAFCSREDSHKQCCSHHERWDHSQVSSVDQEANDPLPAALSGNALKISGVQQPGKWEWPTGTFVRGGWVG